MPTREQPPGTSRVRRPPPPFRRVVLRRIERLTPRLAQVILSGPDLAGLAVEQPAASVRLLLPSPGSSELVIPVWTGNEFLLPDGRRPTIRTFTPRHLDPETLELELWIVVHGAGAASGWAATARPGAPAAVSGTARGYVADPDAPAFLLAGDETALAAVSQLLEVLPEEAPVEVHLEVAHPEARLALPEHARATVHWHTLPPGALPGETLVAAVREADLVPGAAVWAAGEAAAMQRIRRHLFEERGLPRARATVRGYWKHGRAGDAEVE